MPDFDEMANFLNFRLQSINVTSGIRKITMNYLLGTERRDIIDLHTKKIGQLISGLEKFF